MQRHSGDVQRAKATRPLAWKQDRGARIRKADPEQRGRRAATDTQRGRGLRKVARERPEVMKGRVCVQSQNAFVSARLNETICRTGQSYSRDRNWQTPA